MLSWVQLLLSRRKYSEKNLAYLVSHPDEVKLVSYRFGKGATSIDKYLELDGYTAQAVRKAKVRPGERR